MSEYTQAVCEDGAAILKDGQMMTIEEIIDHLRSIQQQNERIARLSAVINGMINCPCCAKQLVHINPGDGSIDTYCEECGWPDEERETSES